MKFTSKSQSLIELFLPLRYFIFLGFIALAVAINIAHQGHIHLNTHPSELSKWVPWICPFHFLTGFLCPGCGLTRSFMAFIQGDLSLAFRYHPAGPFIHTFLIFLLLDFTFFKAHYLQQIYKYFVKAQSLTLVILVLTIIWTILRNMN